MPKYPYTADIELSRLRIDQRNPRLPVSPDSQREAYGELAEAQGSKLVALYRHIAGHGLNPAQRFIVIPDDEAQFIVLDANRRLTALRALEQPDLVAAKLTDGDAKQLKQLAATFEPPDDVACIVFAKREDADPWIELIHEGESDGAGLVAWTAQQKARHRARRGAKSPHLQVLDFVRDAGNLNDEAARRHDRGTYPVSTLQRALATPQVREKLGIDVRDGQVVTTYPKPEVLKGITRLVNEIGSGAVKVEKFMKLGDRLKYINAFKPTELPDKSARFEDAAPLEEAPEKRGKSDGKAKDKKSSATRTKLIPPDFSITIDVPRINDIYQELKRKLRVDEVPNAAGALLRVFLELSIDHYIQSKKVAPTHKDRNLANKAIEVVDHMVASGTLTDKQAIPVREAFKSDDKVNLATNLNALIHNPDMTVSGNDLKALWTRLQAFSERLWQPEPA